MINLETYEKKYQNGYGIQFPEGHIIRIYNNIIKKYFDINSKEFNFLDFGCGNGIHSKFFSTKGFNVFGVDISAEAIELAKINNEKNQENFVVITNNVEIFDKKFDLILANQSLYYLDDDELKSILKQFERILTDNGIVIFTMMSNKNYYYDCVEKKFDNGLSKVVLEGRLNETTYINFTEDFEDLKRKFSIFTPIFCGLYDMILLEGSSEHLYFIGKKNI